jgi:hypothetical protein
MAAAGIALTQAYWSHCLRKVRPDSVAWLDPRTVWRHQGVLGVFGCRWRRLCRPPQGRPCPPARRVVAAFSGQRWSSSVRALARGGRSPGGLNGDRTARRLNGGQDGARADVSRLRQAVPQELFDGRQYLASFTARRTLRDTHPRGRPLAATCASRRSRFQTLTQRLSCTCTMSPAVSCSRRRGLTMLVCVVPPEAAL